MYVGIRVALVALCCGIVNAVGASDRADVLTRPLIFSSGANELKVSTGARQEPRAIYKAAFTGTQIVRVTPGDTPSHVVFDECPIDGRCHLRLLDMTRAVVRDLRTGQAPTYMAASDTLLFYDEQDGVLSLYAARMGALDDAVAVATAPTPGLRREAARNFWLGNIVPIGTDDVVFTGENGNVWQYTLSRRKLIDSGLQGYLTVDGSMARGSFIGQEAASRRVVEITWADRSVRDVPLPKSAYGMLYDDVTDTILFTRSRSWWIIAERTDIVAWHRSSGRLDTVIRNTGMSGGVWVDARALP